jgi:hypothetical protein
MTDLSAKFATLEDQLAEQAATLGAYVDTVEAKLQAVLDLMDIMNINNAANTRALLQALAANSPCSPCPTPSLDVPPLDDTTATIDAERCKRAQAFVQALLANATAADAISAFSVPFAPQLVIDALEAAIDALANGDPTPLMSWAEASNFVSQAITYAAGNFLVGGNLVSMISAMAFDIRDATYSSGSTAGAQIAYEEVVDASDAPDYAKGLLKALAWTSLYNFYFDPASDINVTGYSGTVCNQSLPTECVIITSHSLDIGSGPRQTIELSSAYTGFTAYNDDDTLGVAIFAEAHPGYQIREVTPVTFDSTWIYVARGTFFFSREGAAYNIRFCPPA